MDKYVKEVDIRWADLDPNFHMLHSRYYDLGAYARVSCMMDLGITQAVMRKLNIGPILFREECIFRREIVLGDKPYINLFLTKSRKDASRWSIRHEIYKNEKKLCATINVDGAWIDTEKRKLTVIPGEISSSFLEMPRIVGFTWDKEEI